MDGVDAALVETDGEAAVRLGPSLSVPYGAAFRDRLGRLVAARGAGADGPAVERELTALHIRAVARLLAEAGTRADEVDALGFHGHTVLHEPERGRTRQIGDGPMLAAATGIDTVHDFRAADIAAGGQGAPLAPAFHRALLGPGPRPAAVLNIGGVANVTWIGPGDGDLIGFDTGPGNAPIDDWMRRRTGRPFDEDGAAALSGRVDPARLARLMEHPYFDRAPPKSLDRNAFAAAAAEAASGLSTEDGAALLAAFAVEAVARAAALLPARPRRWIVAGGGRRNRAILSGLAARLGAPVEAGEAAGWDGDAVEAQAFAYLAVRARLGLALSWPGTTGVPAPLAGGVLARAPGGAVARGRRRG